MLAELRMVIVSVGDTVWKQNKAQKITGLMVLDEKLSGPGAMTVEVPLLNAHFSWVLLGLKLIGWNS